MESRKSEYQSFVEEGNDTALIGGSGYDADIAVDPVAESSLYKRSLMQEVIARIKKTLDSHSVGMFLMIIPSPIDACKDFDLVQVDTASYPGYSRARLAGIVEEIARELDIPHVNLFESFNRPDCNSLYFHYGETNLNS